MFGFDIHPLLQILLIFEGILLFSQTLFYIARHQDVARKRFLILVLAFFQFTFLCSIMPSEHIEINSFVQHIIVYISSITVAYSYFHYLIKEYELPQLRMYNIKVLLISLVVAFVFFFLLTYIATRDIYLSRVVFNLIPILISFYFCYQTIHFLMKKWRKLKKGDNHHGSLILSGNIGIVFMATMPITDIFDKSLNQVLNISLVCISLLVTFYAYIKNFMYQSRLEYQFLNKIGFLEEVDQESFSYKKVLLKYNLTARELDVALLVLEGKTYREIGDHMYVNHKTVSKHASNIFRKTNCSSKTEFLELFTQP